MKYGIKDYEELLDKAVQFMKNHGLYDSYWSRESLAQQLAWELTELGEEIDHYGLMDAMESGESKEDMVRKSYQGLLEPGGCEASLNWLEEFLDECEEDGLEVQKVKDTCRKIRKLDQELKEKSGKHDRAVEEQRRGRQR